MFLNRAGDAARKNISGMHVADLISSPALQNTSIAVCSPRGQYCFIGLEQHHILRS